MKIIILILLLISFKSFAMFGFGPCCSGATCGIIPCDSSCAGSAFDTFGVNFTQGLSSNASNTSEYIISLSKLNTSYADFYSQLSKDNNDFRSSIESGLDGYSNGFKSSLDLLTKQVQVADNNKSNGVKNLIKGIFNTKNYVKTDSVFGERSIPFNLNAVGNLSTKFKQGVNEQKNLENELQLQLKNVVNIYKKAPTQSALNIANKEFIFNLDEVEFLFSKFARGGEVSKDDLLKLGRYLVTAYQLDEITNTNLLVNLLLRVKLSGEIPSTEWMMKKVYSQSNVLNTELIASLQNNTLTGLNRFNTINKQISNVQFNHLSNLSKEKTLLLHKVLKKYKNRDENK